MESNVLGFAIDISVGGRKGVERDDYGGEAGFMAASSGKEEEDAARLSQEKREVGEARKIVTAPGGVELSKPWGLV